MRGVTGPRAAGAIEPPGERPRWRRASDLEAAAAMAVLECRTSPEQALLRALAEATGGHGAAWTDSQGRPVASFGLSTFLEGETAERPEVARSELPAGGVLAVFGADPAATPRLDMERLGRIAVAARLLTRDRATEAKLRDALEAAEARRQQAVAALERQRRGGAVAVLGGRFPQVAGRSEALRAALDRLAALAGTGLPVLLEGPPGSGRRHLARALDAHLGGQPERCPVVEMALVPPGAMPDTLRRMEAEAAGAAYVVAGAEHLTPEAASWLCARAGDPERRARPFCTLDQAATGPVADRLRAECAAGRVRVPGLGERLEDLPYLIDALAVSLGRRSGDIGTAARAVLARRVWPGEVAELRQVLAGAVTRAGEGKVLPEHLVAEEAVASASLSEGLDLGYHDAVRSFRSRLLEHALATTGGNRTRAAELLGLQRTYLVRLIRELEMPAGD
jgi:hypothetical protein